VRRVRVDHDELKSDRRSRRRRTIVPNELALLEADELGFAYAYSFICTNLDWEVTEIEAWLTMRALVEEKITDGSSEQLLPPPVGLCGGEPHLDVVGVPPLNISTGVQPLCGLDAGRHDLYTASGCAASSSPFPLGYSTTHTALSSVSLLSTATASLATRESRSARLRSSPGLSDRFRLVTAPWPEHEQRDRLTVDRTRPEIGHRCTERVVNPDSYISASGKGREPAYSRI